MLQDNPGESVRNIAPPNQCVLFYWLFLVVSVFKQLFPSDCFSVIVLARSLPAYTTQRHLEYLSSGLSSLLFITMKKLWFAYQELVANQTHHRILFSTNDCCCNICIQGARPIPWHIQEQCLRVWPIGRDNGLHMISMWLWKVFRIDPVCGDSSQLAPWTCWLNSSILWRE